METPATIRRNPPRKAKLSSVEKSSAVDYRSGRKRYVAEGKTLMPSFTAAEEDIKCRTKQTEQAESLQAQSLNRASVKQKNTANSSGANPKGAGNLKSCSFQQTDSAKAMHTRVTDSSNPECYVLKSTLNSLNAVELESCSPTISAERITASSLVGTEAEIPPCEVPFVRQTKNQASEKVRVFLRIRPAQVVRTGKGTGKAQRSQDLDNRSIKHGRRPRAETLVAADVPDVCLLSQSSDCVTLVTPAMFSGSHKPKTEEFNGFSHVFSSDSTQKDVFDGILAPRLADLLKGVSSLVVAMGPTSAGKTHTMLGTSGDPGLLPRSLQYLLGATSSESVASTMNIVISMFEIYSEQGGRSEKILDLLQDGAELSLHQSKIRGLHEAMASTAEEADAILVSGLQKRTTASTAANHQSSRSHCIINISTLQSSTVDSLIKRKQGTITIADLAGFERERKTKNQGVRLSESSFINNTSMVFGQCLRALLEHQKNPKKTFQRHFQYSMLTKYLKPYMEANGNMTLIVNVSPCEEDYLDTAFVLRQAAPYSNIKFSLLPTKENFESLFAEKRSLSYHERQQHPMKKRRKVDGAINTSINIYGYSNARKLQTMEEVQNIMPGLSNEVQTCQGEFAGVMVDRNMEDSGTINRDSLHLDAPEKLKAEFLAAINHALIQEGVQNSDQVFQAVVKILDNAVKHYHGVEDLEGRLQTQHAEITLLRNNLLKEQEHALALLRELESLKSFCAGLENQIVRLKRGSLSEDEELSRPLVTAQTCSPTKLIYLENMQVGAEDHVQSLEHRIHGQDNMDPSLHFSFDGKNNVGAERLKDQSDQFLMDLPSKNNCEELKEFEDFNIWKTVSSVDESKKGKPSDVGANNTSVDFCTDNGQDEELQVCDSEEDLDLDTSILPLTAGVQNLEAELISDSGQMACRQPVEVCNEEQRAQNEGSLISHVNSLLSENVEVSERAAEEQVKIMQQMEKSLSPDVTMPDVERKLNLGDHDAVKPEQYFKMEHGEKSLSPHVQDVLNFSGTQIKGNLAVRKPGSPQSCLTAEGKKSNLQKGRLLALSLMQESQRSSETERDHNDHFVHNSLSPPISREALGPIGHDLEEILEVPLSELETDLWLLEGVSGSTLSRLLAKYDGLVDISKFPKKFSHQRANCIRYCLVVICGKINIDGKWVSLSKETLSSRKSHFYGVIQARTITEAAGHARAGFQVEAVSNYYLMADIQRKEQGIADRETLAQSGNLVVRSQDNKENTNFSPGARKQSNSPAPIKRRKLQPLSSLSLHAHPNMCPDFDFADANVAEEVQPLKSSHEGYASAALTGNRASTLAYLLTRHNP